jgi:hypothetical protein
LDVHNKTITVCVLLIDAKGVIRQQIRTFGTMTCDLLAMSDWLTAEEVRLSGWAAPRGNRGR